jgi:hypothetical protein
MRPLMLVPAAAFLALAACGDDTQTAQTEPEATTAQPADTAAAPPAVTTTAPVTDTAAAPAAGGTATAPVQETTSAPATTTTTTATAPATDTVETTGAVGAGSLEPGVYQSQNVSLELGPDGNFMLMNPNTGDEAQGQYQIDGNMLVLEGQQMEPMTCEVIQAGEGFELSATDPSCEPLDGESFQRQS